jgi:hypothetical protein
MIRIKAKNLFVFEYTAYPVYQSKPDNKSLIDDAGKDGGGFERPSYRSNTRANQGNKITPR